MLSLSASRDTSAHNCMRGHSNNCVPAGGQPESGVGRSGVGTAQAWAWPRVTSPAPEGQVISPQVILFWPTLIRVQLVLITKASLSSLVMSPPMASAPIPSVLPTHILGLEPTCSAQGQGMDFPRRPAFHYMVAEFNEAGASLISSSTTMMLKIWTLYEQ